MSRLRPAHVVAWCIALGIVVATVFHVAQLTTPLSRDAASEPWIALPRSGMDATIPEIRKLMLRAYAFGNEYDGYKTLAFQCGDLYHDSPITERYIARIGESAFDPSWKVVMDIKGDNIDITWGSGGTVPPPPPPPPGINSDSQLIEPVSTTQKPRAAMERIRTLWQNEALWHAPQDAAAFGCLDGNPVFLEACVHGRYAARARNCNLPAFDATDQLWQAFNELLPPPPEPEWRDAKGNRISP
ncbi:MAG: hypothetical protein QM612_05500 [Thermomonas sp.]|uniref:hypothetical protein n=1 Tax=Thermomonas sp. TaxID=1971895 RepID=UPI0039E2FD09